MTIDEHIIANDVLRNVMDKFKNQQIKGLAKYGETVNPESYDVVDWLNHMQQEMIDGVVYAEVLIGVTSKIVEGNEALLKAYTIISDENKRLKEALNTIATRKMSCYLTANHMNQDFIKIANEALEESK